MEVEIRLPVSELGRLTEVLVSNGFENLFVKTVPLSRGIEWNGTALAEPPRNVNVLVRSQDEFNLSPFPDGEIQETIDVSKPAIEEVTEDESSKENNASRIMPPASIAYDLFGSPESKVGIDQMRALLAQPINLRNTNRSNKINYDIRSFDLNTKSKRKTLPPTRAKKICNICGVTKTIVDDQIKHCMSHYNMKRYRCSVCGTERKQLNFKVHFEKVCPNGVVLDLIIEDRAALLQKVAEMFTVKL